MVGAEALARWRHPQRGLLMPDSFIPMCEDCGMVMELGRQILLQAARQQRQWRDRGLDLLVSVNLSACQFVDPACRARSSRYWPTAAASRTGWSWRSPSRYCWGTMSRP
ncbi:Cyclic di-GMP phosphodiesterase Gmr [Chromobacterium violaceum]|uniref:Cyclic di-GMP phosphodiesterase Gmr n=1 Tax=Chromobacterium violaceum TaxID=536 RepID=A0A447THZ3_CHRVL|nr:Cyclic di-GMP phosphodiesterase Gmr [Chromobacterium violaceum]